MKVFNKGSRLVTPHVVLEIGENEVKAEDWDKAKKLPKIERELQAKRLEEMAGGKPAFSKPEPKPDGKGKDKKK